MCLEINDVLYHSDAVIQVFMDSVSRDGYRNSVFNRSRG